MLLKRALRNASFNFVGQVANLVLGLFFAGMTIRYLGNARAGFFLVAGTILGWIAIAGTGGFRAAAVKHLAVLAAAKDWTESRALLRTVLSANLIVALPFAIASVLAFPYLFSWSKLDPAFRQDARTVMILGAVGFIVDQWSTTLRTLYNAHQRFDLSTFTSVAFGVFGNLARLFVLISFATMASVAWVNLTVSISWLCVDALLARRLLERWILPGWQRSKLRPLLAFGLWSWAGDTIGVISGNLSNLVTTFYLGSAPLPYVVLPQRILVQFHLFLASCSYFLFPTLAGQGEKADKDIARIEDRLRWFIAAVTFGAYTAIATGGYWLLTFLVNQEFARHAMLPLLLYCLIYVVNGQNIVYSFSTMAIGKIHASVVAENSSSMLALASSLFLIPWIGYIGVCIAQLWRIPAVMIQCIWSRRLLGLESSYRQEMAPYVSPALGASAWALLVWLFKSLFPHQIWMQPIALVLGFGLYIVLIWYMETHWFGALERWTTVQRAVGLFVDRFYILTKFRVRPSES